MRVTSNLILTVPLYLIVFSGIVLAQPTDKRVSITEDHRPLARGCEQLEALFGIPVSFEEVRHEYPPDIRDISAQVVRPEQLKLNPAAKVYGVRTGTLDFEFPFDEKRLEQADLQSAVLRMIGAYSARDLPGEYQLQNRNGALLVSPRRMRNKGGELVERSSPLFAPITVVGEKRSGAQTLSVILGELSKVSGQKIVMGSVPMRLAIQSSITLAADKEPAFDVIQRLFASMIESNALGQSDGIAVAYHIYYDPGVGYSALNAHLVKKKVPAITAGSNGAPAPAKLPARTENPFFGTPR